MMRYKLLGPSGLRVSALCLGGMTLGETKPWGAAADEAQTILRRFADAGGTTIDTAPNYAEGRSEEVIGGFIAGNRDDFVISTKYTASSRAKITAGGNSRRAMIQSVEQSLKRLKTDRIDLFWLHYWDGTTPLEEILRGVEDLSRSGKILYFGISDTPAWLIGRADLLAKLRGSQPVAAIQLEYNLAARSAERELLPMAGSLGLGVFCWGPLAAGALADGGENRRRKLDALPAPLAQARASLSEIAKTCGASMTALALQWLMSRGPNIIPMVGARTARQLDDLLAGFKTVVPEETLGELDKIAPIELGFPHDMIASSYLRKLALGEPDRLDPPVQARH